MKAACNELKGMTNFFQSREPNLYFPMLAIIHYRGYCLTAMSVLPLNRGSLQYGSNDCGVSVNVKNPELNEIMQKIGKRLNLFGRKYNGIPLYGAWDIEGHIGRDNKFYALDFGRVFPPEFPRDNTTNGVFYNLLRPSFVQSYPEPLCSDGLSSWLRNEPNQAQINQTILEATKYLITTLIPKVAKELINCSQNSIFLLSQEATSPDSGDDELWLHSVHNMGVNFRHLGYIRAALGPKSTAWKRAILTECVARAIKNELRAKLRNTMEEIKIATVRPYIQATYHYLTPIIYYRQKFPTYFLHVVEKKAALQIDLSCLSKAPSTSEGKDTRDIFDQHFRGNTSLSFKEEKDLQVRFRSSKGVKCEDRVWTNGSKVLNCWIAEEGITWLMANCSAITTRKDAETMLQDWFGLDLFQSPHSNHFTDGYYFYQFKANKGTSTSFSSDVSTDSTDLTLQATDPFDAAYPQAEGEQPFRRDAELFGQNKSSKAAKLLGESTRTTGATSSSPFLAPPPEKSEATRLQRDSFARNKLLPGRLTGRVTGSEPPSPVIAGPANITHKKKESLIQVEGASLDTAFCANLPIPFSSNAFFEVKAGTSFSFSIGLSEHTTLPLKQICSFSTTGMTAVDGHVIQFEPLSVRDVCGVFYNDSSKLVFFTLNSLIIRMEHLSNIKKQLYPSILITNTAYAKLTYNFGQSPFSFPIADFCSSSMLDPINEGNLDPKDTIYPRAKKFWSSQVKEIVNSRFPGGLTKEELKNTFHLLDNRSINFQKFLQKFQTQTGVRFSSRLLDLKKFQSVSLRETDIVGLESRVQHMGIIENSQAQIVLLTLSKKMILPSTDTKEEYELFCHAEQNFAGSLRLHASIEPQSRYIWAQLIFEIALRAPASQRSRRLKLASFQLQQALKSPRWEANPVDTKKIRIFQDVYFLKGLILIEKAHLEVEKLPRLMKYGDATLEYIRPAIIKTSESRLRKEITKMLVSARSHLFQEASPAAWRDRIFWAKALFTAFPEDLLSASLLIAYIHMLMIYYGRSAQCKDVNSPSLDLAIQFDDISHLIETLGVGLKKFPKQISKHVHKVFKGIVDTSIMVIYFESFMSSNELIELLNGGLESIQRIRLSHHINKEMQDQILIWAQHPNISPPVRILLNGIARNIPILNESRTISNRAARNDTYVREIFSKEQFEQAGKIFQEIWDMDKVAQDINILPSVAQKIWEKAYDYKVSGRRIWSRTSSEGDVLGFAIWHMQGFNGPSPSKFLKDCGLSRNQIKHLQETISKIEALHKAYAHLNTIHLEQVCVKRIHWRQGFATALLDPILEHAKFSKSTCSVILMHSETEAFFSNLGFEPADKKNTTFPKMYLKIHQDVAESLPIDTFTKTAGLSGSYRDSSSRPNKESTSSFAGRNIGLNVSRKMNM